MASMRPAFAAVRANLFHQTILLVILVLCASSAAAVTGNCSLVEPTILTSRLVQLNVTGAVGNVSVLTSGGQILPGYFVSVAMDVMTERAKLLVPNVNGSIDMLCNDPTSPFAIHQNANATFSFECFLYGNCFLNALDPGDPSTVCEGFTDQPCSPLLKYLRFSELDCWQELLLDEPIFDTGVTMDVIRVHFKDPNSNFRARASYQVPNGNTWYYPPTSNNVSMAYFYQEDTVKVQYDYWNWPWAENEPIDYVSWGNNGSSAAVWYNTSLGGPKGGFLNISFVNDSKWINYSKDGNNVFIEFQSGFIADRLGYSQAVPQKNLSIIKLSDVWSFNWPMAICQNYLGHWTNLTYDPTLGTLLVPPALANGKTYTGVIVGVCLAAVVVACIIILFIFHEPFRKIITPFWKRNQSLMNERTDSQPLQSTSGGWVAGQPSQRL